MEQLLEQVPDTDVADLAAVDHVPQAFVDEFGHDDAELAETLREFDGIIDAVVAEQSRPISPTPRVAGRLLTVATIGQKRGKLV